MLMLLETNEEGGSMDWILEIGAHEWNCRT